MIHPSRRGLSLAALLLTGATPPVEDLRPGLEAITAGGILGPIKVLASDEFEGRAPGSPGEAKTVEYLTGRFKAIGLAPGNPDGTYVQEVPLAGFRTKARGVIRGPAATITLRSPEDWMAVSRRMVPEAEVVGSELVFVGYGAVAPEFAWNDFKGVDVRGKTLVMLVGDPPVPDPADPAKLDPAVFGGRAMTYYGRWTYKYEAAAERGAAAVLLVHEEGPAGYPYQVVVGSWGRENFDIPDPDRSRGRAVVESWITPDAAKTLCTAAGQDFDALKRSAARRDFRPVPFRLTGDFSARNAIRQVRSRNVLAKLEGSDPKLKDEYVAYTAHWDHLGRDEALEGDQIYNGAADNASGVAQMLAIADGFARLPTRPRRSILFLAVTAEEKGLLGARYYASHPLYPIARTLADINMDVINLWGPTRDVVSVGLGQSTLDDLLADCARARGRVVGGDLDPEKGSYYRSDHFEFAKQGVPALNAKGGEDYIDKPADFGPRKRREYTKDDYHKVSDEVKPDWDLSGAVADARLLLEVGHRVAQADEYPTWKPASEFRARREAMLRDAGR